MRGASYFILGGLLVQVIFVGLIWIAVLPSDETRIAVGGQGYKVRFLSAERQPDRSWKVLIEARRFGPYGWDAASVDRCEVVLHQKQWKTALVTAIPSPAPERIELEFRVDASLDDPARVWGLTLELSGRRSSGAGARTFFHAWTIPLKREAGDQ